MSEQEVLNLRAEVDSLLLNQPLLESRVRHLEKLIDTRDSPLWKRLWWRVDGFPAWTTVGSRARRPWH